MRDSFTILSPAEERKSPFPLLLLVMVAFLLVVCVSPLAAEEKATTNNKSVSAPKSCIKNALLDTNSLIAKSATAKKENTGKMIPKKELLRPMTKKEMRLLLRDMEHVKFKKGRGWAIRALVKGSKLSVDRIEVLLNDATMLLTIIQSKETLDRVRNMPGIGRSEIIWMESAFNHLDFCAQSRFEGWGGHPAFMESLEIVNSYRPELESMFLQDVEDIIITRPGGSR